MALIKCKECGKEFSDMADACPNCGYKPKKTQIVQPINDVISSRYIEEQLIEGEYLIYKCKIHWQIWISPIVWTLFILGPLFLGAIGSEGVTPFALFLFFIIMIIWLRALVRYIGTDLAITNKRVICKFGFISRTAFELNLDKVESVVLKQGILGRIFDCSSVLVRGTGQASHPVPYIADARIFKQKLMIECEKCKKQK